MDTMGVWRKQRLRLLALLRLTAPRLGLTNHDGDAGFFLGGSRKGLMIMEVGQEATTQSAGVSFASRRQGSILWVGDVDFFGVG